MLENFSPFLIINYRFLSLSISLSSFVPFLSSSKELEISFLGRHCIDNFQFDYPFARRTHDEEANARIFPWRRSIES